MVEFLDIGAHEESSGFPRLARAGKSTVWRILDENPLKPHKIRYYLERRDSGSDRKMREVLIVYREVSPHAEGAEDGRSNPVYTVSVDEKPGVQAIGLTALALPPVPGKAGADAESGLRIRSPWHRLDPGRYRSAHRSGVCPGGRPAPESRIHCLLQSIDALLPTIGGHPGCPG
ncbi:hypothetical protein HC024_04510 [Methylococcaceae bacterium WWC4]|nr:hypothetical protein [Methylococcaceae bacterium WWC4]